MSALASYLRHTFTMIKWFFSVYDPIESARDFDALVWAWLTEEE